MGAIASQITSLTIVYSIVYSIADQRKHQSSASLAFVRGFHRGPVNSPHKWPVTRKMFPFDDVIMIAHVAMPRNGQYKINVVFLLSIQHILRFNSADSGYLCYLDSIWSDHFEGENKKKRKIRVNPTHFVDKNVPNDIAEHTALSLSENESAGNNVLCLAWYRQWFGTGYATNHWYRADSRLAPSQWETSLQSNAVSHWLGANLESALLVYLIPCSSKWRHNGRDSVSNHQPHDCFLDRLFRHRSKKTSKLRVTGLCAGNSQEAGEFPA